MASRRSNELLAQLESKSTRELRELALWKDEFGQTALHLATNQDKSSVTEQVIAAGCDVNLQTTVQKVTAVFISAQKETFLSPNS